MNTVHLVMQGKGGVGKSYVAYILAQYLRDKDSGTLCVDTDPLNPTLMRYESLSASFIQIADQSKILMDKFDELIDIIAETKNDVLIDTGSPTFLPLSRYLIEYDIFSLLKDEFSKTLLIHVVINAKTENDLSATISGLDSIAQQFPEHVRLVVWLNEYTAPIKSSDGRSFEEMTVYENHRDRIDAIIRIPETDELTLMDINRMLNDKLTFDEVLESAGYRLMSKSRLKKVRNSMFSQMENVFNFESKESSNE